MHTYTLEYTPYKLSALYSMFNDLMIVSAACVGMHTSYVLPIHAILLFSLANTMHMISIWGDK